jgi:6-phosphogluconolactonase
MRYSAMLSLTLTLAAGLSYAAPDTVYFGTYTGPESRGIYYAHFDAATGKFDAPKLAAEIKNPSWVTLHPNRRYLYAVTEIGSDGRGEASVSSFSINADETLTKLNEVPAGGGGACHLAIDRGGRNLAVANYGTGSVAVFRLEADGKLGSRSAFIQHTGSSLTRRQQGPHAHAVVLSADERYLFVPDLGLDHFMSYRFDRNTGTLAANDPPFAAVKPGSGPRHFAFHPKGKYAYGLNEIGSTVSVFSYDKARGTLKEIQNISTLPANFSGNSTTAEIQVDRRGRFVYASNRGDDSITVFAVGGNGMLTEVERVPTQGKTPRNFSLDPSGRFLLAANQNTGNVVVFRVDAASGKLVPSGAVLEVPSPVCIEFLRR